MTNIILIIIILVLAFIADKLIKIESILEKPKPKNNIAPTVTSGSYAPVTKSNTSDVGISEAKTPQLVEFEAEQELLKRNQSL